MKEFKLYMSSTYADNSEPIKRLPPLMIFRVTDGTFHGTNHWLGLCGDDRGSLLFNFNVTIYN